MSVTMLALLLALEAASPRGAQAIAKRDAATSGPLGVAVDLTLSLISRPERSMTGADLDSTIGLRGAYLWTPSGRRLGPALGGELMLHSGLVEGAGTSYVRSDTYYLNNRLGGIAGYRLATQHAAFTPHLSIGVDAAEALVHLQTPGNDVWRPRFLAGPYFGGGVIASFFAAMLRLDVSYGYLDGRGEYRFNAGIGGYF